MRPLACFYLFHVALSLEKFEGINSIIPIQASTNVYFDKSSSTDTLSEVINVLKNRPLKILTDQIILDFYTVIISNSLLPANVRISRISC